MPIGPPLNDLWDYGKKLYILMLVLSVCYSMLSLRCQNISKVKNEPFDTKIGLKMATINFIYQSQSFMTNLVHANN